MVKSRGSNPSRTFGRKILEIMGIMKEYCKSGKYHQGQEFANIVWKQNQYNQSINTINTIFMKVLFYQKLKEQTSLHTRNANGANEF